MSFYQELIQEINPSLNPAGVESLMRLQYSTLSHLSRETFVAECALAAECEKEAPGTLKSVAESFGMGREFEKWEKGV